MSILKIVGADIVGITDKAGAIRSGEEIDQIAIKKFLKENPDIYNDLFIKTKDALELSGRQEESVQIDD